MIRDNNKAVLKRFFIKSMNKKKEKIILFFLFSFSIYCAIIIGQSWDEPFHYIQGQITLKYLFSLGRIDKDLFYREYYSPIYWSLQYLFTELFPIKYQIETGHLVNLAFSLSTIVGIAKISKELFNKKVGKIVFLVLFFYPVFFGHMSFNPKDSIIAFCHVWIFLLSLTYIKQQTQNNKTDKYVFWIGLLAATGTGVQLVFLGLLIPVFLFILAEIFLFKKIISKNFMKKKFLFDLIKCFIVFYFFLILFWIDVHENIFLLPLEKVSKTFSSIYLTGWPTILLNEKYYLSLYAPKFYLILNFIFKTPEYFLISYLLFIIFLLNSKKFFDEKFEFFNYKLSLIILILLFPNILLIFTPYPVYDGMRLFLWIVPYLCIIPALSIYYLLENYELIWTRLTLYFLSMFIVYFLYIFLSITPYQYTYLNILSGKNINNHKKFENDYWASSVKELVKHSNFESDENVLLATCGVNPSVTEFYLKKRGYTNFKLVAPDKANYVIMTNRSFLIEKENEPIKITNCFDIYEGKDLFNVRRNNLILSVIRKIN